MKYFITIFLGIISVLSSAQNLPDFDSNIPVDYDKRSVAFQEFAHEYEILVVYTQDIFWTDEQYVNVLGYKNGKWKLLKVVFQYEFRTKAFQEFKKVKSKKITASNSNIDNVFKYWEANNFLALNQDSLSCSEKKINDSITEYVGVSDGCTDIFEIFSKGKIRIMYAYEAERFQESIYINQRQQFIECKNMFFDLFKSK